MSRSYSRHHDDHAGFILVILLAGAIWAHRAVMLKIEHIAHIFALIVTSLVCLVWLIKFIRKIKKWHRRHNPDFTDIDTMTGLEFERHIVKLLEARGYERVRLTEEYDLGVDIIAVKDSTVWGIQVKRYSGLVGANAVRQVVTALNLYSCERAMVITNSYFSAVAKTLAFSNDCILIDRNQLLRLDSGVK
jgi:restriction system protein